MEIPAFNDASEFFAWVEEQLGDGWTCSLVSTVTPGVVRLQLMNSGDVEFGWRTCAEGPTFEEALQKAIDFTHSMTPDEYMNKIGFGV